MQNVVPLQPYACASRHALLVEFQMFLYHDFSGRALARELTHFLSPRGKARVVSQDPRDGTGQRFGTAWSNRNAVRPELFGNSAYAGSDHGSAAKHRFRHHAGQSFGGAGQYKQIGFLIQAR